MRIAIKLEHVVYLDVPEGVSVEDVRKEATDTIFEKYEDEEGHYQDSVTEIITNAVKVGIAVAATVSLKISEEPV